MTCNRKTPAGCTRVSSNSERAALTPPCSLTGFRAQIFAARYGLAVEVAGTVAALALGGAHG